MSKIQKALETLREARDGVPPHRSPGARNVNGRAAPAGEGGQGVVPDGSQSGARGSIDSGETMTREKLSQPLMHVDLESLRESGLYPDEEHVEQIAQQFRRIKRPVINLAFGDIQPDVENPNLIMMASALPKSGKTYCSLNLASSIARERDIGAVLVDADVLKPNISRALGLEDRIGLIDHLLDPSISVDDILVPTDWHNIVIIPAGRQHDESTELLASRRMQRFVAELSRRFRSRAVIVDTPPLLLTNEAHVLAEHMGQIVMVIEAGVSTRESVLQALESLNRDKPINAILNKSRGAAFGSYGTEGYGYYSVPQKGHTNDERQEQ